MAVAGKVAITLSTENGGAWSADVTYDRLVAVKHNNSLYISRKVVTNVEPPNDEFWFLTLEGYGGDDVQALINRMNDIITGTTQVGNAKTLDGHGASYFATDSDLVVERERISNLAKLNEGSTTGDAELVDIRVGANGETYANAGNAVRGQITDLKSDLADLEEDVETYKTFNISNAPSYFEVTKRENSNADASSGRVILGDLNGYTSYYFNIKKNCKICLLESGLADYTAIVIGSNPTGNWETVGASYRIQCTSSVRYRTSESNLPTLENSISVSKDDVIAITVKGGTNNAKIVLTDTETGLNHSLNLDGCANKISMVSNGYIHVKTENNVMYLHIPTDVENKFLQYKFFHYSLSANKADGWVLSKVFLCTKVGEEYDIDYPVVYDGEWELAIKLHGRPDYIGCRMHGSEITTYYKFYVDGKPYAFDSGHDFNCNEFRAVQKSTMYDPNDEVTIVGYHYWHHIITPKDIKIEQRVEWIADCQVDRSYTGMLPIARGNDDITSVQVTDRAYDTITFEEYDVSTGGFDNYMHDVVSGRDMYYIYGSESGVNATMKCTYKTVPIEKCGYIQNTINDYNKLYLAYCNDGASVSNGDVWEWETKYTLNVANIN